MLFEKMTKFDKSTGENIYHEKKYTLDLLERMKDETKISKQVLSCMIKNHDINIENIKINPNTWMCNSNLESGEIILGSQDIPDNIRKQLIFEDWNYKDKKQKLYLFNHEISHFIIPKLLGIMKYKNKTYHKNSDVLFNLICEVREKKNLGFSTLGNLDFYRQGGAHEQANEDHTELINMYLLDPQYLKRYLSFLSDEKFKKERDDLNLIEIDNQQVKDFIYDTIQNSVEYYLDK